MNRKKLTLESVAAQPWGPAFVREFELTVAANVFEEMANRGTLYESVLASRVAERCRPLDGGLVPLHLGIVDVPTTEAEDWRNERDALEVLDGKPRGTWAIFRKDGKYDAYMADGAGGYATRSGYKFQYGSEFAPDLTFEALYPQTLSMEVYLNRGRISNEIVAYSASIAAVEPGTVARDKDVGGKTWDKVELLERRPNAYVGGGDMFVVGTRSRGRRPARYEIEATSFVRIFDVPMVMPPRYADPLAAERVRTLGEIRQAAAQKAWDAFEEDGAQGLDRLGTKAEFRKDGDVLTRPVYGEGRTDEGPCGAWEVTFAPGSDVVVDSVLERKDAPAFGM